MGLAAAPAVLAATAVGAGAGAVVGKARDSGVSDALMKQIGSYIEGSEAGPFIPADDSSSALIAGVIEEFKAGGADVSYEVIPPEAQDFLREALKPAQED
ncbi:MAG: DUF1269 domain-containing protein [Thermoleophilia bacterium]